MPTERLPLIHAQLSELALHEGVPAGVRQLFETAKNVSLYTYFVYRFHQVSQMVAHAALEMALKLRAGVGEFERGPGLYSLLRTAIDSGWITQAGFSSRDPMARSRAQLQKAIELITRNRGAALVDVPEPSAEEVASATRPFDLVSILLGDVDPDGRRTGGIVDQRNELAHGSRLLHPSSRTTLRLVAEVINQLFPRPTRDAANAQS